MKTEAVIVNLIVVIFLNVLAFPMILIWSINTLLGMHIDFTVWNWLASWMLISAARGVGAEVSLNK